MVIVKDVKLYPTPNIKAYPTIPSKAYYQFIIVLFTLIDWDYLEPL